MRVPLSWLNEFLPRPLSAREADDVLGEAGIAVTVIDAPGRLGPRVVAGRVRTADDTEPLVDLPTPERVSLPEGAGPCPPPGAVVAVALPGSRLFAPRRPGADGSRYGLLTVPPGRRDGDPVGRVCSPAELGTGPGREACVLPPGTVPGTPVSAVLPETGGEVAGVAGEILRLTVPDTLVHCTGLWGLAHEIASRDETPDGSSVPHDLADPSGPLTLSVARADWTVSAVAVVVPDGPAGPLPGALLARMTLAGIPASGTTTDALSIAAYEYGTRLTALPVPGPGPIHVTVGEGTPPPGTAPGVRWPADLPVRLDPAPPDHGTGRRLLVLAASPSVLDTDATRCTEAARRAARLLSGTEDVPGVRTVEGPAGERHRIALDVAEARAALGADLTPASCTALLARIGARASRTAAGTLDVRLPPSRTDLRTQADVIAELMRLHGYRALPATSPTDPAPPHRDARQARVRALRDAMAVRGFQEVLTPLVLDPGAGPAPWREPAVHLEQNGERLGRPLRRSLVPGLVAVAGTVPRHAPRCAVFETGTVVRPEQAGRAPGGEGNAFAALRALPADAGQAEHTLGELGACVRAAVQAAGVTRFALRPADLPGFRPGSGALILADGVEAGGIGLLCEAVHHELAVAEIDLSLLLQLPRTHRTLSAPSRHPAVELDVNLLVPDEVPAGELPRSLSAGSPLVRSARVSDVYRGRGVPPGHRAITVTLGFASPWRTLTRGEATSACEEAVAALEPLGVRRR
ncbi:hypothetical protein [Streptomyces sp. NPDC046909]|uniref:phenylalanine--tRNA ligase subunit beta-related protein n=1 Tax=Streptomyces sp. NPDC046909 TaxID=3155617 RepID=UPI00340FF915